MYSFPLHIPTYDQGTWTETVFNSHDEFKNFVLSIFKEPGKYRFDKTSHEFNSEARRFRQTKLFCSAPLRSKDFVAYWEEHKLKCRVGVIFKNATDTWYLTRDYYMWINFLPLFDKEQQKYDFPQVRDAQYHMALYELLAELHYKHSAILKKRQIASSYFHAGKLINGIWFEEGFIGKMGASLKDYINEKGTWKFLDEYRGFLNQHTAWYRPMNPGKVMMWEQKIETTINGRKFDKGLKGKLQGMSFEQDPTTGVGGPCRIFFYEEGGIAPEANTTYGYAEPALRSGLITVGMFIIAGSVGDLSQCEPLKDFLLNPEANSFYAVETNLIDNKGTIGKTALFIPEQWSMPPYIDEYGNSLVEEALKALDVEFAQMKKDLSPEQYQLKISQRPRTIEEAFAFREESKFPMHIVSAQKKRIEDKTYPYQYVDLYREASTGKVAYKETNKLPISKFPVDKKMEDKTGTIVMWEPPVPLPTFGMYYGSIDPVGEGKTTTSESLTSIYIMKNAVEVTKITPDGPKTYIEPERIVATWCGRFDDINKTHERLEMLIELYNAWTVIENNISLFIQHMIQRNKQKYLVPKDQIVFLKDIGSNKNVFQEYGWKNTGTIFKSHLLNYGIEFIKEEIDVETDTEGNILKVTFGVERIPDPMLLEEMTQYRDGVNVDRLVSFCALVAFCKIQQANRGYMKRVERTENQDLENREKFAKLNRSPFRHIGTGKSSSGQRPPRSAFKNLK